MLEFIDAKNHCTGCEACRCICPKHCITMEYDEEGFLYPHASSECIHCGACKKICPQVHPVQVKNDFQKKAFCALTNNTDTWIRSTSGGAFSEIAECWGDNDTIIYGASWDNDNHHVVHIGVDKEYIDILRKSKYIASKINQCFSTIKKQLEDGKYVLFSGTPCQVAGLRSFLGKPYRKLLLVEIICHGVGSDKVFQAALDTIGRQFGQDIISYEFRSKRGPYETDYLSKIKLKNGKELYLAKDQYVQLFLEQKCLRPSCGAYCQYRNPHRQSDLTIADFKGLKKVFPELRGTKYNYSTIIVNSEKGDSILSLLEKRMVLIPCDIDIIRNKNPLFFGHVEYKQERDSFFSQFVVNPELAIYNNTKPAELYKMSIKRKIYNKLPVWLRRTLDRE